MLVVCLSHLQLIPDVLWPPNQQLTTLHVFAFAHLSHYHTSGYICLPIWTLKWENGQWNKQHKALLQWKKEENSVVFFWAASILKIWFKAVNKRRWFKRKGESTHTGFFRMYIPLLAWLVDTPEEHSRFLLPTSERGEMLFSHRSLLIWFETVWIQT